MKLTRFYLAAVVAVAAQLALAAWGLWQVGPDATVPIHWNAAGVADDYGSALFSFLLVPVITVGLSLLLALVPRVEPRKMNLERSASAYVTVCVAFLVMITAVDVMLVLAGTGRDVPVALVIGGSTGLLFAAIGNVLTTVRSNFFFGVRTPWTLSSELSWDRTHRLTGRLFVVAGLLTFAASLLGQMLLVIGVLLGFMVLVLVVAFVYSYVVWRDDPDRRPTSGVK